MEKCNIKVALSPINSRFVENNNNNNNLVFILNLGKVMKILFRIRVKNEIYYCRQTIITCVKEPGIYIYLDSRLIHYLKVEKNHWKRLRSGHEPQGFEPKALRGAHAGQAMPLADCATISRKILCILFFRIAVSGYPFILNL